MSDWPGEQPEHDHPFPPCPACAWAIRELEAELRLANSKIQVMLELPPELQYKARAEKAEARVAELEREVEENIETITALAEDGSAPARERKARMFSDAEEILRLKSRVAELEQSLWRCLLGGSMTAREREAE